MTGTKNSTEKMARAIWTRLPCLEWRRSVRRRLTDAAKVLVGKATVRKARPQQTQSDRMLRREYVDYKEFNRGTRSRQSLLDCVETGCRVLDELDVDYWIGRGTLLGWHRDGDFLPGDLDVDIGVRTEKHFFEIVQAMPFKLMGVLTYDKTGGFHQLYFLDQRADILFDLWIYHDEGDQVVSHLGVGTFSLPKSFFSKKKTIHFEGRDYPIPDPDAYLAHWYGADWRQPKHYGDTSDDWVPHYERDCQALNRQPNNQTRRWLFD